MFILYIFITYSNISIVYKGYSYKPIIAFHVVEKPRKTKKNGEEKIIRKGNFDSSSRQMEHAILIALIEKLTPLLEEQDILLNVTIDGDLDSNKTLGNVGIVNQIFADLKHVTKNIRKNCNFNSFISL